MAQGASQVGESLGPQDDQRDHGDESEMQGIRQTHLNPFYRISQAFGSGPAIDRW
jgi:hypothetical protein